MIFPGADTIACALVAAARETGENPESFIDRSPDAKFRHYALHALLAAFPGVKSTRLSDVIGCPGKPCYFYRSSMWWVLGQGPHRQGPVEWWSEEAFGRVCAAVADKPVDAPKRSAPAAPTPVYAAPPGKRHLYDMLREAAANTAKLQPKEAQSGQERKR